MGRKTNPNILRLGVCKNYNFKYIEKKSTESALYSFKNLEIYNFIYQFFKNNNLKVQDCKINFFDNNLHVYISYYSLLQSTTAVVLKKKLIKKRKDKILEKMRKKYFKLKNKEKSNLLTLKKKKKLTKKIRFLEYYILLRIKRKKFFKRNKNILYKRYKLMNFIKLLLQKKDIKNRSFLFFKKGWIKKQRRYLYKSPVNASLKSLRNKKHFLSNFIESLNKFLNKNFKIYLTIKQLNKNLKKKVNKKDIKIIRKQIGKLYRYRRNEFFKEGVNTLFICCQQPKPTNLLADFIANQLKKTRRHNFFLKFLKKSLTLFKNHKTSKLKGIKIKVTGKLNRSYRARHKTVKVGNILPVLSIKSNIDYSEKTAFTPAGTIGVKIWACSKNN